MSALWLAPTKGGSLTTEDRLDIRAAVDLLSKSKASAAADSVSEDLIP
jgi:hypothetical protein